MKLIYSLIIAVTIAFSLPVEANQVTDRAMASKSILLASRDVGVPGPLLLAICETESSLRPLLAPKIDGLTPSYGLCQIKLETAQFIDQVYKLHITATPERLAKAYINAYYAGKYLRLLLLRYGNDWEMASDAYNKGHYVSHNSQYVQRVREALKHHQKGVY